MSRFKSPPQPVKTLSLPDSKTTKIIGSRRSRSWNQMLQPITFINSQFDERGDSKDLALATRSMAAVFDGH